MHVINKHFGFDPDANLGTKARLNKHNQNKIIFSPGRHTSVQCPNRSDQYDQLPWLDLQLLQLIKTTLFSVDVKSKLNATQKFARDLEDYPT